MLCSGSSVASSAAHSGTVSTANSSRAAKRERFMGASSGAEWFVAEHVGLVEFAQKIHVVAHFVQAFVVEDAQVARHVVVGRVAVLQRQRHAAEAGGQRQQQ